MWAVTALVRPGTYTNPKTGQAQLGYYLTAYTAPTGAQLDALRADSLKWQERRNNAMSRARGYSGIINSLTRSGMRVPDETTLEKTYFNTPEAFPQQGSSYPQAANPYSQPMAQRPVPTQSKSEPAQAGEGNIRDIRLLYPEVGSSCNVAALLDTGCLTGNWISSRVVNKLGTDDLVEYCEPKTMQTADGGLVQSKGTVKLDWRWSLKGVKVHTATFNVADASHYDVILGNEYLVQNRHLTWNQDSFSPLTEHDPVISPYELEAMRQAALRQQQERADRQKAKKDKQRR